MNILQQILDETEATPISTVNGMKVYDFHDTVKVTNRELAVEKLQGKEVDFGERETRENGLAFTHTKCNAVAINPENYFINRYRKLKEKTKTIYEVVTDYRAIKEQNSGRVYTNNIIVHRIALTSDKLEYIGKKIISDSEFINEFKGKLNVEAMEKIAGVIIANGDSDDGDSLEI